MPPADMALPHVAPAAPAWPAAVGALTTTRAGPGGVWPPLPYAWNLAGHVGDDPAAVARRRAELLGAAGLDAVQWLDQVHGTRCLAAGRATAMATPAADAAWTTERGLGLAVLTADCLPVVLCDRSASVVAVAHGGWRGLAGGIVAALVAALPVPASALVAWLGPAIGGDAYEVGDDVVGALEQAPDGARLAAASVRPGARPGKHQLDLYALGAALLSGAGVAEVQGEPRCARSDARFFSYRRDGVTGRMATLVWRR